MGNNMFINLFILFYDTPNKSLRVPLTYDGLHTVVTFPAVEVILFGKKKIHFYYGK